MHITKTTTTTSLLLLIDKQNKKHLFYNFIWKNWEKTSFNSHFIIISFFRIVHFLLFRMRSLSQRATHCCLRWKCLTFPPSILCPQWRRQKQRRRWIMCQPVLLIRYGTTWPFIYRLQIKKKRTHMDSAIARKVGKTNS